MLFRSINILTSITNDDTIREFAERNLVRCPYLTEDELCSIYETRPECCRSFPNRNSPNCYVPDYCDLDCKNCKDKCCNYISLDSESSNPPKPIDFYRSLDIKCDNCTQCWIK